MSAGSTTITSLSKLPSDILTRIFCYLGNVPDLLHCEQTCQGFRRLIKPSMDDNYSAIWISCRGGTEDFGYPEMSHRERASVIHVLRMIRKEQKRSDNIFQSVLGVPLWIDMIHFVLHRALASDDYGPRLVENNNTEFHIRGDASFVLMEMAQQSLISQFHRGILQLAEKFMEYRREGYISFDDEGVVLCAIRENACSSYLQYPVLTSQEFIAQVIMQQGADPVNHPSISLPLAHNKALFSTAVYANIAADFADIPGLSRSHFQKIIRRISARAGVVKLSNEVYNMAWKSVLQTILTILIPACHRSAQLQALRRTYQTDDESSESMQVLHAHELMRNVAPLPYYTNDGGTETCHHVLVPKQLEDATRPVVAIESTVYGDGWHVGPNSTREQEVVHAQSMYEHVQNDDDEDEDDHHSDFEWDLEDVNGMVDAADYLDAMDTDNDEEDEILWTSDDE